MDRKNVLEIEYKQINDEFYAWWITHQDEEVLPRWYFEDDDLCVYSFGDTVFNGTSLWIQSKVEDINRPIIITDSDLNKLIKIVAKVNEKYGKKKKTPEEIFAKYTPVPFVRNIDNHIIYFNTDTKEYCVDFLDHYDFGVSGANYYNEKDAFKIVKELNDNCR